MPKIDDVPPKIKPYKNTFKVEFNEENDKGSIGTCPFCSGVNKFFVFKDTGQYGCRTCSEKGNIYTFIRRLHELGSQPQSELEVIAEERKIDVDTLKAWGLTKSHIDHEWMLPGYGLFEQGKKTDINNLYKWVRWFDDKSKKWKRKLQSTATLNACLFGTQFWDPVKQEAFITEGPFDGMKLWETLRKYKVEDGELVRTVDVSLSLYSKYNVVSVPGADTFKDDWASMFIGKSVIITFDNDYPKLNKVTGKMNPSVGYEGTKMVFRKIRGAARSVSALIWGPEGYSEDFADGYDLRDLLSNVGL